MASDQIHPRKLPQDGDDGFLRIQPCRIEDLSQPRGQGMRIDQHDRIRMKRGNVNLAASPHLAFRSASLRRLVAILI